MLKQSLFNKLLLIIPFISLIIGCAPKSGAEIYLKDENYKTKGFLNDDIYQVTGTGTWPNDYANKRESEKKKTSRINALDDAQKKIINQFNDYVSRARNSKEKKPRTLENEIIKKIENYAINGSIVMTTYDEEFNCSVVYRVYAKDLKKNAQAGFEEEN